MAGTSLHIAGPKARVQIFLSITLFDGAIRATTSR
jgi:hypothetical protein